MTFTAAAAGLYPGQLEIIYQNLSSNLSNNGSDASVLMDSTGVDSQGKIIEDGTGTAVFRATAASAISGGTAATAEVSVRKVIT